MKISTALLVTMIAVSSLVTPSPANAWLWWAGKKLVKLDDTEKKEATQKKGVYKKNSITDKKEASDKKNIPKTYMPLTGIEPIRPYSHSNSKVYVSPVTRRHLDRLNKPKSVTKVEKPKTKSVIKVISNEKIISLSKLSSEVNGTVIVGRQLGKLNLSTGALENTYLRIAVHQNRISKVDADEMFVKLHGVPGFVTTLRKITGNNENVTSGHLNELKIAAHASKNGFEVLSVGERFNDGIKKSSTDIDVVLSTGKSVIALEAKDYSETTKLPLDKFRADLDSLIKYKERNSSSNVIPVFSLSTMPNTNDLKLLEKAAFSRDVKLIIGPPKKQIEQIKLLGSPSAG